MKKSLFILVLCIILNSHAFDKSVYKLTASSKKKLEVLLDSDLDIWRVDQEKKQVTAVISKNNLVNFADYLPEIDIKRTQKYHNDLASHEDTFTSVEFENEKDFVSGYECYRTVEKTYADLQKLANANPDIASVEDIGNSWKYNNTNGGLGYKLKVIKITNKSITRDKPVLFIDAAIHAREMATAELVTRFAEKLINDYNFDPEVRNLLDNKEVHIVPHVNPDGRKIAEGKTYKRKNENNNFCTDKFKRGIDLNRNFETVGWQSASGRAGSTKECSQVFKGLTSNSESETQALINYLNRIFRNSGDTFETKNMYLSMHSFSELILLPDLPEDKISEEVDKKLKDIALKLSSHNDYKVCKPSKCLYRVHGSSADWVFENFKIPSYTFELGTDFFQSCGSFEEKIVPRNMNAFLEALKIVQ